MGERPWARVERVDHCARVAAYYGGGFSVRRASLRAPERAFFSSGGRKRKRAALDALVAQGKFVPLDERVKRGLRAAHDQLLAECSAVELLSRSTSSEDDAQTPLTATLTVRGHTQALYSSGSDRVEVARVLDGANDLEQYQDDDRLVLVPPRASFAAADVRELGAVGITRSFRWIVMDPPWENKSVGRGRRYATFHHTELLNVDVPGVASSEQCVLLIWVTNKPAYTQFLLHEALPQWGFTYHDTWFWLKVCANADLVTPLDSTHRLPFEKVIIAYRAANESVRLELKRMLGDKTRVIASVPLRHSWKPPPESFFPSGEMAVNGDALELFARELRPKWTSIGLEVLKFQDVALFVSSPGASSDANASSSDAISSQPATQDPTS